MKFVKILVHVYTCMWIHTHTHTQTQTHTHTHTQSVDAHVHNSLIHKHTHTHTHTCIHTQSVDAHAHNALIHNPPSPTHTHTQRNMFLQLTCPDRQILCAAAGSQEQQNQHEARPTCRNVHRHCSCHLSTVWQYVHWMVNLTVEKYQCNHYYYYH